MNQQREKLQRPLSEDELARRVHERLQVRAMEMRTQHMHALRANNEELAQRIAKLRRELQRKLDIAIERVSKFKETGQ